MPKIVLNEYDKTKAGISAYANFSVVVPGFLGKHADDVEDADVDLLFDENGVYECSSQTDFKRYIGKKACQLKAETTTFNPRPPQVSIDLVYVPDKVFSGSCTDGVSYMIESGSITGTGSAFTVYYKNETFYSEALNAWHTNSVNLSANVNAVELERTVKYILEQNEEYLEEAASRYSLARVKGADADAPFEIEYKAKEEEDEATPAAEEEETVTTVTASVDILNSGMGAYQEFQVVAYTIDPITSVISTTNIDGMNFETSNDDANRGYCEFAIPADYFDLSYLNTEYNADGLAIKLVDNPAANSYILYRFPLGADESAYDPHYLKAHIVAVAAGNKTEYTVDPTLSQSYKLYTKAANASGEVGFLKATAFVYSVATTTSQQSSAPLRVRASETLEDGGTLVSRTVQGFDTSIPYHIILNDNRGSNGDVITEEVIHYGNQIAYELLGMGYTVLYKSMSQVDINAMMNNITIDEVNTWLKEAQNASTFYETIPSENSSFYPTWIEDKRQTFLWAYCDATPTETGSLKYTLKPEKSSVGILNDPAWWEALKDKSTYDFRYIVTGLLDHNDLANVEISKLAHHVIGDDESGRGDCIALLDIDRSCYTKTGYNTQKAAIPQIAKEANKYGGTSGGKYSAVFAPTVTYTMAKDVDYGDNCTFPGSFHYLACAAKAAENYSEWYANAGYTRGMANYVVETTGCKLGELAVQALEPRSSQEVGKEYDTDGNSVSINSTVAVNLIIKIKNNYYLWGNRTAHVLEGEGGDLVASHFLNIRQLCTTLKKQVYVACRKFTFDPNSTKLWLNFCSAIRPTLEKMKADQGIKDYAILPEKSNKKAILGAKIRIVPIEAVEDFYINMFLEDSISGPDVTISESE